MIKIQFDETAKGKNIVTFYKLKVVPSQGRNKEI